MNDFIPELVVTGKQSPVDAGTLPADEAEMLAKLTGLDAELMAIKVPAYDRHKVLMAMALAEYCEQNDTLPLNVVSASNHMQAVIKHLED